MMRMLFFSTRRCAGQRLPFNFYCMNQTIRFCYRKIIDATSAKAWERLVHEDSYTEFKMQAQRFNQENKYHTFGEIVQHNPSAEQLHFLVSGAVVPYIQHLEEKVPDVLNVLGKHFLVFKNFRFEIINSHMDDHTKHRVAINFYSEPLVWIDTVGDKMIVSTNNEATGGEWPTETMVLSPFLSICSVKQ
jgi:hypothetical protein